MSEKEKALSEWLGENSSVSRVLDFSEGWNACAKLAINKEKLIEWLKAMESQCAKASFVEHTYDEVRQIIELGEFDLK